MPSSIESGNGNRNYTGLHMKYETYKPGPDLEDFVKCYWTLKVEREKVPPRQRIIPDGCMEMIFHHGDLFKQYLQSGEAIEQPRCFVFGQITCPLEVEPTGAVDIFSVRFCPEGFTPFATVPVVDIENRAVSLEDLFGLEGKIFQEHVLSAVSVQDRIGFCEQFLKKRFVTNESVDRTVKACVDCMLSLNGQISVSGLSEEMNMHRRQIERRFAITIGLSPKQLAKVLRLQGALKRLMHKNYNSLTELAYEGEYYDQAHFIRDFKEFTGLTPRQYYSDNLKMSALFSSTD